jgi:hypothetical protein
MEAGSAGRLVVNLRRPGPGRRSLTAGRLALLVAAVLLADACGSNPTGPPATGGPSGNSTASIAATAATSTSPPTSEATGAPTPASSAEPTSTPTTACGELPAGRTSFRVFASDQQLYGTSVARAADCSYLVAVSARESEGDIIVGRLDLAADTLRFRQLRSSRDRSSEFFPYGFHSLGNEIIGSKEYASIVLLPLADGRTALASDALVMVVDRTGTPAWSRQYLPGGSHPHNLSISSIVRIDDGFVVVGARRPDPNSADIDTVLMRLDESGNVVWARELPNVHATVNAPLLLTPDRHLLLGGWVDAGHGIQDGAVARLSLDGDLEWIRTVHTEGAWWFQTIAQADSGDIFVVQSMCHGVGQCVGPGGAVITRLTRDGSYLWSRHFHHMQAAGGVTIITQVRPDGDGLLLVGGSTGFQEPGRPGTYHWNFNAVVARLDGSGSPAWIRSLGDIRTSGASFDYSEDVATSFAVSPNGMLVVAGYTNSFSCRKPCSQYQDPSHADLLLAVTDPNGLVRGIGDLMSTADLADPYEVWTRPASSVVTTAAETPRDVGMTVEDVTYTVSDITLQEREIAPEGPMEVSYEAGGKVLVSNVSIFEDAATDIDGDTIRQEWENTALQLIEPIFEVDEEEDWLENRADYGWIDEIKPFRQLHHAANFVRVTPWPSADDPRYILFHYAVTWSADYGGGVTGVPFTALEDHRGDVERVVIATRLISDRRAKVEWVYTSAHSSNRHHGVWHVTDRSCSDAVIVGKLGEDDAEEVMCGNLEFSKGQVVIQASEDKHAMYPSEAVCESVTLVALPGPDFGEDCGWQPSKIPVYSLFQWEESDFTGDPHYLGHGRWQFDAYNIGEPDRPHWLIDDLDVPSSWRDLTQEQVASLTDMFPGETVWSGTTKHYRSEGTFCGGLEMTWVDWFKNPDRCVGNPGNSVEATDMLTDKLRTTYRVSITTAGKAGAGTDSDVYLALDGTIGTWGGTVVGSFEKGNVDVLHVGTAGSTYGDPVKVRLRIDNTGDDPPWLVTKIVVESKRDGRTWSWANAGGQWVRGEGDVEFPLAAQG